VCVCVCVCVCIYIYIYIYIICNVYTYCISYISNINEPVFPPTSTYSFISLIDLRYVFLIDLRKLGWSVVGS